MFGISPYSSNNFPLDEAAQPAELMFLTLMLLRGTLGATPAEPASG